MENVIVFLDYYPGGSLMPGRTFNSGDYRYGFQGYEKDNEVSGNGNHLSFNDFGYDPRIARRWNIDPKTSQTPWQSPYIYAADNPVAFIDIDGEGDIYYILSINQKSGKAAFKTVEYKDNTPNLSLV